MNHIGVTTQTGPGDEPQYLTFGLAARSPYSPSQSESSRESHHKSSSDLGNDYFHRGPEHKGLHSQHGLSDQGVDRMTGQLDKIGDRDFTLTKGEWKGKSHLNETITQHQNTQIRPHSRDPRVAPKPPKPPRPCASSLCPNRR